MLSMHKSFATSSSSGPRLIANNMKLVFLQETNVISCRHNSSVSHNSVILQFNGSEKANTDYLTTLQFMTYYGVSLTWIGGQFTGFY